MEGETRSDALVIGLTGPVGSGVSTLGGVLGKNGFQSFSLSSPIKEEFRKKKGLAPGAPINEKTCPDFRKELQNIGNEKRQASPTYWLDKVLEQATGNQIVIAGIRNLSEVRALRQKYFRFCLIAVNASSETRFARSGQAYDGLRWKFDRDDERDSGEGIPHGQQVTRCVDDADYVFGNEDELFAEARDGELWSQIQVDIDLMRSVHGSPAGPLRAPTLDEGHMAAAYAEGHLSACLKRHVGAVIVAVDGKPLSLGFNENPIGMPPCVSLYKACFKDGDMHRKLREMGDRGNLHCPQCGAKIESLSEPWLCVCKANLKKIFFPSRNIELCTAIHAEERAINSLSGRSAVGATIYATTFPCFQCARYIVDQRISRVVYVEAYPIKESYGYFRDNNVQVDAFKGFKARAFNLVFRQVE